MERSETPRTRAGAPSPQGNAEEADAQQPRVLVVDDDLSTTELLATLLHDEGYLVRTASSGTEGLQQLQSWRPQAVLLDLFLPEMDGRAFLREQQRLGLGSIPVIVVTAVSHPEPALAPPPAAVITKPFDLDQLLDCLREVLGRPR